MLHSTAQHPTKPLAPSVRHFDARIARKRKRDFEYDDFDDDDDDALSETESVAATEKGKAEAEVGKDVTKGEHGEAEGQLTHFVICPSSVHP